MVRKTQSSGSIRKRGSTDKLRDLFASFPSGVTVVTSSDLDGKLHGTTVSAFTPVSLEPPLVLVSLDQKSRTAAAISQRKAFVVHLLDEEKFNLAIHFAQDSDNKFKGISYTLSKTGVPYINECATSISCTLASEHIEGDHVLIIGAIDQIEMPENSKPLIYHQRSFHSLGSSLNRKTSSS